MRIQIENYEVPYTQEQIKRLYNSNKLWNKRVYEIDDPKTAIPALVDFFKRKNLYTIRKNKDEIVLSTKDGFSSISFSDGYLYTK